MVGLGSDTVDVSVAAPPTTHEQALRVAMEHFAFCPDNIWTGAFNTIPEYAEAITDLPAWSFWCGLDGYGDRAGYAADRSCSLAGLTHVRSSKPQRKTRSLRAWCARRLRSLFTLERRVAIKSPESVLDPRGGAGSRWAGSRWLMGHLDGGKVVRHLPTISVGIVEE